MMKIYVGNCLTIRSDEGIKALIKDLKNHGFGLKIEENLKHYSRFRIKVDKEDGIAWIQQPH
jgi:hypothetical protein